VVAVAENGVIGRGGNLPWRMPSDLKAFRTLTMGKPVVMGRRTYASLKKPLDGRDMIVLSREADFRPEGVLVVRSIEEAVALAHACAETRGAGEIMVIGGADVFAALLPAAARLYWTDIHGAPAGDTLFPAFDAAAWRESKRRELPRGPNDEFTATLRILDRIRPAADGPLGGASPTPA
jgi:dihydrofolate reductase